ncbi:MAG: hypothetical protein C0469_09430 [Cyanobacteria bacterium DS2.3.42]|nr:hypothetical protein [Cyanobacteria bacterium DS2.3.42]
MPNPTTPGEDNRQPLPPGENRNRPAADGGRDDTYFEKLLKYVPGDIVAAFVAIDGLLRDQALPNPLWLDWTVFGVLLILAPLYAVYRPSTPPPPSLQGKRNFHAVAAMVAFTVWVFALGGPFATTWPDIYRPMYGSILLIFTTLIIPLFEKILLRE